MSSEVKTLWYCLKTYVNKDKVRWLAQEYADHNRDWFDPQYICNDEAECRNRCEELNRQ